MLLELFALSFVVCVFPSLRGHERVESLEAGLVPPVVAVLPVLARHGVDAAQRPAGAKPEAERAGDTATAQPGTRAAAPDARRGFVAGYDRTGGPAEAFGDDDDDADDDGNDDIGDDGDSYDAPAYGTPYAGVPSGYDNHATGSSYYNDGNGNWGYRDPAYGGGSNGLNMAGNGQEHCFGTGEYTRCCDSQGNCW